MKNVILANLQHAENCVNIVFSLGPGQTNINTLIVSRRKTNTVNTVVLGFRGAKNIGIYGVFAPRVSKNAKKPPM